MTDFKLMPFSSTTRSRVKRAAVDCERQIIVFASRTSSTIWRMKIAR
jgi:hypothetical protein